MKDRCVLILSCDKYSDLWESFFLQFWKYWPDCPYPVYLGSNTISYTGDKRVKTILSGKDRDWSTSLISILKQIPEKSLLLMVDDMFLRSRVRSKSIDDCFAFLDSKNVRHIHLRPVPTPDAIVENGIFGIYEKGAPYRINTVGFWRVSSLLTLLLPGENSWLFETLGSYRSRYDDGFYAALSPVLVYVHIVEKGKIIHSASAYCQDHAIPLPKTRSISSSGSMIQSIVQAWYFNAVLRIPWKMRVGAMSQLRKLFVSY